MILVAFSLCAWTLARGKHDEGVSGRAFALGDGKAFPATRGVGCMIRVVVVSLVLLSSLAGCLGDGDAASDAVAPAETGATTGDGGQSATQSPPVAEEPTQDPVDSMVTVDAIGYVPYMESTLGGHLEVRIDGGAWGTSGSLHTTVEGVTHPGDNSLLTLPLPEGGHTFDVRFVADDERFLGPDEWQGRWTHQTPAGVQHTSWSPQASVQIVLDRPGPYWVDLVLHDPERGMHGVWQLAGAWSASWNVTGTIANDVPGTGATANRFLVPADGPHRVSLESRATEASAAGLGRTLVLSGLASFGYVECRGGASLAPDQDDTHHFMLIEAYEPGQVEAWVGAPANGCYRDAGRLNVEAVPYQLSVVVEPLGAGRYWY